MIRSYLSNSSDKTEFQDETSDEILKPEFISSFLFLPTGTGKTKVALDVIKKMDKSKNLNRVLVLVFNTDARDNTIPDEFSKWGMKNIFNNKVDIMCYASSHKIQRKKYDIILYDECHHLTFKVLNNIVDSGILKNCKKQIFLTATKPTDITKLSVFSSLINEQKGKAKILKESNLVLKSEMSISEARKRNFIADFNLKVFDVKLDNSRKIKGMGEQQAYDNVTGRYEYARLNGYNTKFVALERLRLFQNLPSKSEKVKELRKKIPNNQRYIVFCGSIKQADSLSKYTYHSKSGDKWLKKFINKEINSLSVVNRIDESANIPDVDGIIVVQSNSQSRSFIQRSGRALRFREGHKAFLWLIRCINTVDEKWVQISINKIRE